MAQISPSASPGGYSPPSQRPGRHGRLSWLLRRRDQPVLQPDPHGPAEQVMEVPAFPMRPHVSHKAQHHRAPFLTQHERSPQPSTSQVPIGMSAFRPAPPAASTAPASAALEEHAAAPDPLHHVLASLALRDLTLVESLLQMVEKLEAREEDPQQLRSLFQIDHLATRMRRNSENLLILAGQDIKGEEFESVPLLDVARAAISEITHYTRAQVAPLPDVLVVGLASDDLSHILAELLDNATSKSPESTQVLVRGELTGDGTLVFSIEDSGIGIPVDRLAEINARLSRPPVLDSSVTRHMGLYVVNRLAHRHGIRVHLRERHFGGTVASVIIPARLIREDPRAALDTLSRDAASDRQAPGAGPDPLTPATGPDRRAPGAAHARTQARSSPAAPTPAGQAPRFQPADPASLPKRIPSALSAAPAMPVQSPRHRLSDPTPSGSALPGPTPSQVSAARNAGESEAEQVRDELAGFQLGQRAALRDYACSAEDEATESPSVAVTGPPPDRATGPLQDTAADRTVGPASDTARAAEE